MAIEPKPATWS